MNTVTGWAPKRLTQLAEYINGYAFKPDDWGEDGLPIIRIEQLKNPDAPTDYFDGKLPTSRVIEDGDLIFSWSASLFLRIWRHGRAALNQHLFKVVESEGVDRQFLKAFIEFNLPQLTAASHGSTMQHITRKELERFCAPFPKNKCEQTKIAEILSTMDRAIEQTEALIAKQQRIKNGLMQDLLTRGIDEHGNLRSEATHKFKDSRLGRIPMEWEIDTIGNLFNMQLGKMLSKKATVGKSPAPYVGNKNVQWDSVDLVNLQEMDFDEYERKKYALVHGDLLVCEGGEVGRTAMWRSELQPCFFQKAIHRLRPKNNRFLPGLMLRAMRFASITGRFADFTSQTSIAHLTQEKLAQFPLPVPPITPRNEQGEIIRRLDKCDDVLESETKLLRKLFRIKDGLMQDLLTGKKRVTPLLDPELTN